MNTTLTKTFNYESTEVRTITKAGDPWFVASDVCLVLGIAQPHHATASLDEDEKGRDIITTLGGPQEVAIINEPGLYSLILRSRKPEAKAFKRWITHEVIPTLRKTGIYIVQNETPSIDQAQALDFTKGLVNVTTRLDRLESVISDAHKEALALPEPIDTVLPGMSNAAQLNSAARIYAMLTGKKQNAVWPEVYNKLEFFYKIRISVRKKNAKYKGSTLTFAVENGYGEKLYRIIYEMIISAIRNRVSI